MIKNLFVLLLFGFCGILSAQNLETCTEAWCYDKDGNLKKELQFDPYSIQWPLHFTGENIKNEDWILVKYEHHGQKDISSLSDYRKFIDNKDFCKDGVDMPEGFECEYGSSGKPRYRQASCSLVGMSKEEKEIRIGVGSCYKKIIDWTIIDWCAYDPKADNRPDQDDLYVVKDLIYDKQYYAYSKDHGKIERDGAYHFTQVIKIGDHLQPTILHSGHLEYHTDHTCKKTITIGNKAKDEGKCPSETFKWTVQIFGPHGFKKQLQPIKVGDDSVQVKIEDLEIGHYDIKWRVTDGCNNPAEEKMVLEVKDKSAPVIHCKGSFSVGVGAPDNPITVWASDFVKSVTDNCTEDQDITISFSPDEVVNTLDLTCEKHLGDSEINIYATDAAGNQSYCIIKAKFSTNDPACTREVNVQGSLSDRNGHPLSNINLSLKNGQGATVSTLNTDGNGRFTYAAQHPINEQLTLDLDQDVLTGHISTMDLVTIQKHVTGVESINTMYDLAAADINGDHKIDAQDVHHLRGYLLGITIYQNDLIGNRLVDMNADHLGKSILLDSKENLELVIVNVGDVY